MNRVAAIIVAAGESRRMEGIDKVFAPLKGKQLIAWVIDAFERCSPVDEVVVVVNETSLEKCRMLAVHEKWSKVTGICAGGDRRQDSVMAGLDRGWDNWEDDDRDQMSFLGGVAWDNGDGTTVAWGNVHWDVLQGRSRRDRFCGSRGAGYGYH